MEKDSAPSERASFGLEFTIPTKVEKYSLTPQSPVVEIDGGGFCLIAISNSVVSLRSKGASLRDAKVYARNAKGEYLDRKGASWSDSSYRAEYKGSPASVDVVVPVKTSSVSIEFKDLAAGKDDKLRIPNNPTNAVVVRHSLEPMKTFSNPDMAEIAAASMTYVTNGGWQKNNHELQFPKPAKVEVEQMSMSVYLAGTDEFVGLSGKSGWSSSGSRFYWDLRNTNALNAASAIFGELEATFWTDLDIHSADVSTNPVPLISGRESPLVSVEHNVVWVEMEPDGKVMDIQAFDASGRQLKKDNRTSSRRSKRGYFFWGSPRRVSLVLASSKASVSVPFAIELKEGGVAEVAATREKVAAFEEFLAFTKEIDTKARSRYGNLLSANYYAFNSKQEPKAAIPVEAAHSDPVGAAVFGYELKPCKGYYFRKILTDREVESNKSDSHVWAGGSFEAPFASGVLLATPVDPAAPSILLNWGRVSINYNNCSTMTQLSTKSAELAAAGWIEIK